MPKYTIDITKSAEKELAKIPTQYADKIVGKIRLLADSPYPNGCKKLAGSEHSYRIRIGDYRVIYTVFDDKLVIQVIKVGHRKEVYR